MRTVRLSLKVLVEILRKFFEFNVYLIALLTIEIHFVSTWMYCLVGCHLGMPLYSLQYCCIDAKKGNEPITSHGMLTYNLDSQSFQSSGHLGTFFIPLRHPNARQVIQLKAYHITYKVED